MPRGRLLRDVVSGSNNDHRSRAVKKADSRAALSPLVKGKSPEFRIILFFGYGFRHGPLPTL